MDGEADGERRGAALGRVVDPPTRRRLRARPLRSSVLGSTRGRRLTTAFTYGSSVKCMRTAVFHSRSTLNATRILWRRTKMSFVTAWVLGKRPLRLAKTAALSVQLKFHTSGGHSSRQSRERPVALPIRFSKDRTLRKIDWARVHDRDSMDGKPVSERKRRFIASVIGRVGRPARKLPLPALSIMPCHDADLKMAASDSGRRALTSTGGEPERDRLPRLPPGCPPSPPSEAPLRPPSSAQTDPEDPSGSLVSRSLPGGGDDGAASASRAASSSSASVRGALVPPPSSPLVPTRLWPPTASAAAARSSPGRVACPRSVSD